MSHTYFGMSEFEILVDRVESHEKRLTEIEKWKNDYTITIKEFEQVKKEEGL